ncbi:MAG TPA: efflux RND transporter periplasmic adaptor subunit [Myxococcales bacterium]|jgi:HlyD family secretion protein|nr:efflux RND transporter periplasmic adaptor subunit [Myxococcales bacterium]
MATPPPSLADELKSLRIDRGPAKSSLPGWLMPAAVVLALAALAFVAWKTLGPRLFAPEVEITSVTVVTPAQGAQILVATGYVVPQRKANISPRIGGRVAKIFVEDGTVVKAGQVIAVLEDADYRAQLAQAQADRKSAEARQKRAEVDLIDAQRQFEREQIVQQKGVSTPAALDTATARLGASKAALAAAEADVAAAGARVDVARVNLDNCYVRAPFAGRITQKLTDIGEIVFGFTSAGNAGNGGIASLADFTSLQVEADVSESQVAKLAIGTPAEIALDAFPDRRFRGRVAEVRPRVDRAKATVTVKVAFVDDMKDVLPDMGSKVTFLARELDAAAQKADPKPAVSPDAVVARGDGKVVFVLQQDGSVKTAPVITGPALGNLLSLQKGPAPGTRLVRSPPADLMDGMRVKEKQ